MLLARKLFALVPSPLRTLGDLDDLDASYCSGLVALKQLLMPTFTSKQQAAPM